MKHFLNREMLAPNVLTVPASKGVVSQFRHFENIPGRFSTVRPHNWGSDIRWISAADEATFELFQSAFEALGVADHVQPYVDVRRKVRLYAGFLVVRSECRKLDLHVDWVNTNNQAFTYLTPVSANAEGFGLSYMKLNGELGEYDYKEGEAIIFGDHFRHGTKIGTASEPVTLLCFEFGTDRIEHWPSIYSTIGYQVTHIRQPDGKFVRAHG